MFCTTRSRPTRKLIRGQPLTYRGVANMIDPARLSPTAKYLFSITPLPNQPQINPLIGNNWIGPFAGYTNGSNTSIRIDQRISDRDLLYGRYSYNTIQRSLQLRRSADAERSLRHGVYDPAQPDRRSHLGAHAVSDHDE